MSILNIFMLLNLFPFHIYFYGGTINVIIMVINKQKNQFFNRAYLCFKITLTLSAHLQIKNNLMITILDKQCRSKCIVIK